MYEDILNFLKSKNKKLTEEEANEFIRLLAQSVGIDEDILLEYTDDELSTEFSLVLDNIECESSFSVDDFSNEEEIVEEEGYVLSKRKLIRNGGFKRFRNGEDEKVEYLKKAKGNESVGKTSSEGKSKLEHGTIKDKESGVMVNETKIEKDIDYEKISVISKNNSHMKSEADQSNVNTQNENDKDVTEEITISADNSVSNTEEGSKVGQDNTKSDVLEYSETVKVSKADIEKVENKKEDNTIFETEHSKAETNKNDFNIAEDKKPAFVFKLPPNNRTFKLPPANKFEEDTEGEYKFDLGELKDVKKDGPSYKFYDEDNNEI